MQKAGVIGLGVGRQHALAYQALGLDVVVFDFGAQFKEATPKKEGWAWGGDWRQVIDRSDIVSVCSWDQYHEEQVIYALEQDKHVLCEKPLAHTSESLERIKAAAEKSRGILDVSFPLRAELGRFALGAGTTSASFNYYWGRNQKLHNGWRRNTPNYNVTCGGLIHMIDLCEQMVGKIDNDSIEIWCCNNVNSSGMVDYDEINCECIAGAAEVLFGGHFAATDGIHIHTMSLERDGQWVSTQNSLCDKTRPIKDFYNAVTHPTIKFTPDPFSANLTAIAIHEKAMEYLHG